MHPDLPAMLQSLAECPPDMVRGEIGVFADWLQEIAGDPRADVVRGLWERGVVEVEPVYVGYNPQEKRSLWSYGDEKRRTCDCGWKSKKTVVHALFHCPACHKAWWIPWKITCEDAAREMQHRLRVECLCWFWDLLPMPCALSVDARWPPLHINTGTHDIIVGGQLVPFVNPQRPVQDCLA